MSAASNRATLSTCSIKPPSGRDGPKKKKNPVAPPPPHMRVLASLAAGSGQEGERVARTCSSRMPAGFMKNVRYEKAGRPLDHDSVKAVIAVFAVCPRASFAGKADHHIFVIRPSGTEPVIPVMAEGDDQRQGEQVVDTICEAARLRFRKGHGHARKGFPEAETLRCRPASRSPRCVHLFVRNVTFCAECAEDLGTSTAAPIAAAS